MRAAMRNFRAEILLAAALLGGWFLITAAIAELAPARVVWPLSLGLLLLSCGGWGLLRDIARDGLYLLAMDPEERRMKRAPRAGPRKAA